MVPPPKRKAAPQVRRSERNGADPPVPLEDRTVLLALSVSPCDAPRAGSRSTLTATNGESEGRQRQEDEGRPPSEGGRDEPGQRTPSRAEA